MEYLPKSQDLIPLMMIFIDQIEAAVGRELAILDVLQTASHSWKRTEFQDRLAWARTKAKSTGWIYSPKKEYWVITNLGKSQFRCLGLNQSLQHLWLMHTYRCLNGDPKLSNMKSVSSKQEIYPLQRSVAVMPFSDWCAPFQT